MFLDNLRKTPYTLNTPTEYLEQTSSFSALRNEVAGPVSE